MYDHISICKACLLERSPDGALRAWRGNALPVRRSQTTQRAVKRARSAMTRRATSKKSKGIELCSGHPTQKTGGPTFPGIPGFA